MKNKLVKISITLIMIIGIAGCTNPVKEQNITEKVTMQKEVKVSDKYLEKISIITGRLDGMNQAVVQGLTETLDTARLAREMAENALAIAKENQRILTELQQQAEEGGGNAGAGAVEQFDNADDF